MPQLVAEETVVVSRSDGSATADVIVRQHIVPGALEFGPDGQPSGSELSPDHHILIFDVTDLAHDDALSTVVARQGDIVHVRGSVDLLDLRVEDIEGPAVIRIGSRLIRRRAVRFATGAQRPMG